ncbi:Transmembrane 4 L6 family member 18 [Myotis davidii]|uniref:Transmembrane 4 L6 family member 18 n=1 Tax=Myotis davidii TaxID=225400 RepID=L5LBM6_MYODS|nr:Transmembrane 4 L6 family member 18 [Myotis davidii]
MMLMVAVALLVLESDNNCQCCQSENCSKKYMAQSSVITEPSSQIPRRRQESHGSPFPSQGLRLSQGARLSATRSPSNPLGLETLLSIIFSGLGISFSGYCLAISALGLIQGPYCRTLNGWEYAFEGTAGRFLTDSSIWIQCLEPAHVVEWNIILFSILIALSGLQVIICLIRVVIQLSKILCGTYSVIIQVTDPHWHLYLTHFTLIAHDSMSSLKRLLALTGLAQWIELQPWTQESQVRFQSRACTLVAGTSPVGDVQEAADRCFSLIDVSNSLSFSLPLCKKSIKYIF